MDSREKWVRLFQKRFRAVQNSTDALPGETTYEIPDRQVVVIIKAPTPAGAMRAESLTDTEECLIINRGQGKRAFVSWDVVEGLTTAET